MRAILFAAVLLAGCRTVYRGSDLDQVVLPHHRMFIEKQMKLLEAEQFDEFVANLEKNAGNPEKFEKAGPVMKTLLDVTRAACGKMRSYQIVEAEGVNDSRSTNDAICIRVTSQHERGEASYTFEFDREGDQWKATGFTVKSKASSKN